MDDKKDPKADDERRKGSDRRQTDNPDYRGPERRKGDRRTDD